MRRNLCVIVVIGAALGLTSTAWAGPGRPNIAALQVGLRSQGFYNGSIDGILGADTTAAVNNFAAAHHLSPTGPITPQLRKAFGSWGSFGLGSRILAVGASGWDVAALQFALAWHGFPSGDLNGRFGAQLARAVSAFQGFSGIPVDGRAGPQTLAALRRPLPLLPISLTWPLTPSASGDGFGVRGNRFHTGVDLPDPTGTSVAAAAGGTVTSAGILAGGYGITVVVDDGGGVETIYAHLSRALVTAGAAVVPGQTIGLVGATGDATGPHLHFETRLRGAAVDPQAALPPTS